LEQSSCALLDVDVVRRGDRPLWRDAVVQCDEPDLDVDTGSSRVSIEDKTMDASGSDVCRTMSRNSIVMVEGCCRSLDLRLHNAQYATYFSPGTPSNMLAVGLNPSQSMPMMPVGR
jgi:hypothetical protein